MRKAVNYAIDRPALAGQPLQGGPGQPTDQFIPPGMLGFQDASDLSARWAPAAEGEATRTRGRWTCRDVHLPGPVVQAQCGGRAREPEGDWRRCRRRDIPRATSAAAVRPGERWDIAEAGWIADYADPFDMINVPFGPLGKKPLADVNSINFGRFDDPRFERRLRAVARESGRGRYRAYAAR